MLSGPDTMLLRMSINCKIIPQYFAIGLLKILGQKTGNHEKFTLLIIHSNSVYSGSDTNGN